ncbi:MAG: NUDIX domain-containing protein [Candidatus Nitrohelix vancouverensis]|uniref:NUDIX domain-containing protein n=1 Tax=Candidatus Nitrohelix vancouverensis TaxID=2705534 RepID=A0A7T0G3I6_9BACT|nr:MAG: NUDIX domain-containing protein [Candidatus Nitrohelix vancouverensis]
MDSETSVEPSSGFVQEFVGAVVVGTDGKILCQLRDDIPGIQFPGRWTCSPGGHMEAGEVPRQAILRELQEEFGIEVERLELLDSFSESEASVKGTYHAFMAKLKTPEDQVRCYEGQEARLFAPEIIPTLNLHPVSLKIFNKYLERQRDAS